MIDSISLSADKTSKDNNPTDQGQLERERLTLDKLT